MKNKGKQMKISLWSSYFYEDTPEDALKKLSDCGYCYSELSFEHAKVLLKRPGTISKNAGKFVKCADDLGINVTQAHLSFDYDPIAVEPKKRALDIEALKRELELYCHIGVRAAVLHVGGGAARKKGFSLHQIEDIRTASLLELCKQVSGTGLRMALENLVESCELPYASDLLRVIELTGCPDRFGICLDTGHLNLAHGDPSQFVREAGKNLIALHIADNLGEHDDHLLPFGGKIKWAPFMKELKKSGYDGHFNFEIPGERLHEESNPVLENVMMLKAKYALNLAKQMYSI